MSELDQNIPDDRWRKAFEEAAETPPPRVWDAIERRLDEDEGPKILPLWGAGLASSRPFIWVAGLAAAVALLLVGWWAQPTPSPVVQVASNQPTKQVDQRSAAVSSKLVNPITSAQLQKPVTLVSATVPKSTATSCWPSRKGLPKRPLPSAQEQLSEAVAQSQSPARNIEVQALVEPVSVPADSTSLSRADTRLSEQSNPALSAATLPPTPAEPVIHEQPAQLAQRAIGVSSFRNDVAKNSKITLAANPSTVTTVTNTQLPAPGLPATPTLPAATALTPSFEPVATSSLRLREPRSIQRIVWFHPDEPATEEVAAAQPKRATRAVWASVSMMPSAFNPSVAVRSAQSSYGSATSLSNAASSQPSVRSQANISVAYQAAAGVQLSERWSVESGVGYLAGRSTVESPVQASVVSLQATPSNGSIQSTNLYLDALRGSIANAKVATNAMATLDYAGTNNNRYAVQNNYNPQTRQSLTNNYQFVQVPVQVGYQLRPRKRLGLALLGGLLSNIFVRNTVGDELVITSKDGIYRPVSWAASVGARFRYRPSRQWSASLAGLYQPSLSFGTKPASAVQTRPTSTGMSFGIDYHF